MIHKTLIVLAICLGSLAIGASDAEAGHGHFARVHARRHAYRPVHVYRAPVVVARPYYGAYHAPIHRHHSRVYAYPTPIYRSYSPYSSGYIGPSVGYGYGGYGRSGISIGIGF